MMPPWRRLAVCLGVGALLSMAFGTDSNWDLQNYHLYAPFALLNGRLGLDYFAGGFQGYFNPLADLPYFLLRRVFLSTHPVLVAGLAGLPYGAMAFLVIGIARALLPGERSAIPWAAFFAAGIGLSGATLVSEIGTSFGDIVSGDALLLGVLIALRRRTRWSPAALGAGLGAATALKFTAVIFAPGLALWMLALAAGRRGAVRGLLGFAAGGSGAFLLLWGWWGWTLWRHFHNPVFPLLGHLFVSPWSFPVDVHDPRFFPRNVWQWVAYPFFWLQGRSFVATEGHLRDPRFALAYLALLAVALRAALPRVLSGELPGRNRPPASVIGLWLFAATSYLCWLIGFSILRYAVPLEALTGIVLATALRRLRPGWAGPRVLGLVLLACLLATRPMGWGRIAYGRHIVEAPLPVLPARAMVFIIGAPLGFVVPSLATPERRFVRLDFLAGTSPEVAVVHAAIADGTKLFVLTDFPPDAGGAAGLAKALAPLALTVEPADCQPVHTPVEPHVRLCPVTPRAGALPTPAR